MLRVVAKPRPLARAVPRRSCLRECTAALLLVSFALRIGALAQLGERLLCKHQVIGSIPISSTTRYQPRDEEKRFPRGDTGV